MEDGCPHPSSCGVRAPRLQLRMEISAKLETRNPKLEIGEAMPHTSRRTSVFTESIIREMSRVAARHNAINLAQGFPDWDPPAALVQAAKDAMDAGRHQYAVTWGSAELRTALGAKLTRFMGIAVDAERELVVTCGATE